MNRGRTWQTIAIDVDDVLAAEAEFIVNYSNAHWRSNLKITDYQEYWQGMWRVDYEEARRREVLLHQPGIEASYRLIDGADAVLRKLSKHYRLVAVTSRQKVVAQETRDWLQENFRDIFEEIIFTNFWDDGATDANLRTKAAICKRLSVEFLIDDQPKHCIAAAECGMHAVLFGGYPWQHIEKLPVGVTCCKDWRKVEVYFDAKS